MLWQVGDMWSIWDKASLFVFSGNSTVTANGRLVMGRGLAKQVRDRFPGVDVALGKTIRKVGQPTPRGLRYGFLVSPKWEEDRAKYRLAVLQVKYGFNDEADPDLIVGSLLELVLWAQDHPDATIHMNAPGIGAGRLPVGPTMMLVWGMVHNTSIRVWVSRPETLVAFQEYQRAT